MPGGPIEIIGAVGDAIGRNVGRVKFLVSIDPLTLEVCQSVVIHEGAGWRWRKQLILHRFDDGRLEQTWLKSPRRRRETIWNRARWIIGGIALLLAVLLGLAYAGLISIRLG